MGNVDSAGVPPLVPVELAARVRREGQEGWLNELPDLIAGRCRTYPPELVELGVDLVKELRSSQAQLVVVHGDFHPGNVLNSQRAWLSIDCKPLVGEPAFDLATLLANRLGINPAWEPENPDSWPFAPAITVGELARQVDYFTDTLELERTRVIGWTVVKALAWNWGPAATRAFAGLLD